MAFTDPFIRRPVLATVVSLLIVLLGFQAWSKLPLRQYPQMENALITVTTAYPGANAETIQGYITQPMQQSLASAEGIDYMTSVSRQNFSVISVYARIGSNSDRLSAQLKKNQATVNQLKASLAKKQILAPFSGTIGIRQVDVGDYLASGTVIATLQDLSSLYVDFYVPEQTVPRLAVAQSVNVSVSAYPGQNFVATISAINPKVEDSTRNVLVRATLANPDGKLLPGMFANLEVILPDVAAGIVVPESAVTYTLYGNSMYVVTQKKGADGNVEKDDKGQPVLIAERRSVETGERRDGQVLVTKGVQRGEQIVIAGQLKLDNGTPIAISDDKTLTEQNSPPRVD